MKKSFQYWPVIVLGLALGLSLLITRHYGESWDELKFYKYAGTSLEAYLSWPRTGDIPLTGNTYDNYGPVYVMFVSLAAQALRLILPWIESDLRHLIYFFTFLAGLWAFYQLARRWLSHGAALGATLLFGSQPLFWGHAFISPKDIPFLTFFMLSLVFGLRMADTVELPSTETLTTNARRKLTLITALWLTYVLILFGGTNIIHGWLDQTVRAAAAGESNLVSLIASDIHSAEPEIYIQRYFVIFLWVRAVIFWSTTAFLAWVYYRLLPSAFSFLRSIAPAALFLGITICIRVLGPLAGLIVTLYALRQKGKRALPMLAAYIGIALITMYATWPYLWPDPIGRFIESVIVMARYPWLGQVLFDGVMYDSTGIPRSYLPVLLGIQLTEPVWILGAAGLTVTILGVMAKRRESHQLLALTSVWFVFPLITFIALRSPLYDNFRQIFFILPPVFLLAGAAFEKIKKPLLQAGLVALVILPGVIDGVRLHPYEYIHYNRFIGGVHGAFRRFELDYWGTSYREAAEFLNQTAPEDANIWVEGPTHLLELYTRPDLQIYSTYETERAEHYDYVVAFSRYDLDLTSYPDANVIHTITREDAILTVIKQP